MFELSGNADDKFLKMQRRTLTGEAKWGDIEDLINRWARRNPRGAYELEQYIKQSQENLLDKKHGLMEGKSKGDINIPATRIGIALHPELLQYIEAFYPKFLSTKAELHEFKKRFKKFRIPEL